MPTKPTPAEKAYIFFGMSHDGEAPQILDHKGLANFSVRATCPQRAASKAMKRIPGETQGIIVTECHSNSGRPIGRPRIHAYVYDENQKGVKKCRKATHTDEHLEIATRMLESALRFANGIPNKAVGTDRTVEDVGRSTKVMNAIQEKRKLMRSST